MRLLTEKARAIQQGDYEFIMGEDQLAVFWIPDEYLFLQWILQQQVEAVYAECLQCFEDLLATQALTLPPGLLREAFALSQLQFQLDLQPGPFAITLNWNLWEYWQGLRRGEPVPLQQESCHYVKDWEGKPFSLRRSVPADSEPPVPVTAAADRE